MKLKWTERMNDAIAYIENNLYDKIDYTEAARICCCSLNRFQTLFHFFSDMTLSEYVRQRRMSLAAEELYNSDIKVIDLAMNFAYDSAEAFTRAYQAFHGCPPTATRKFGIHKNFDRISIHVNLEGGISMDTRINKKIDFEDLVSLDESSAARLLQQISDDTLMLALKGASPTANQAVYKHVPVERANLLKQMKEDVGPVQIHTVEDAQTQITEAFRRLLDEGEIKFTD